MSGRWKYQIRKGLPFGIIMPVILTLVEDYGTSTPFLESFISKRFAIQLVLFLFAGIFIIGYSAWRERAKNEMYNKS